MYADCCFNLFGQGTMILVGSGHNTEHAALLRTGGLGFIPVVAGRGGAGKYIRQLMVAVNPPSTTLYVVGPAFPGIPCLPNAAGSQLIRSLEMKLFLVLVASAWCVVLAGRVASKFLSVPRSRA